MHEFQAYASKTGFQASVWTRRDDGRARTFSERFDFPSHEAAEKWAGEEAERLDSKAQEFASDPMTQHCGL